MVLASVFYVHGGETDESLKTRLRQRVKNNMKWFGVTYSDEVIDSIVSQIRAHTMDFVTDGESFKLSVKYRE